MTLANWFTLLRLFAVPIVAIAYWRGQGFLALVLFLLAAATDMLDGWLARARGEVSDVGKVLDPVADKALQLTTMILLVMRGAVPVWPMALLLGKELALILGGAWLLRRGQVVSARFLGKFASVLLFPALGGGLAGIPGFRLLLYSGVAVSLLAGLDYLVLAVRTCSSSRSKG